MSLLGPPQPGHPEEDGVGQYRPPPLGWWLLHAAWWRIVHLGRATSSELRHLLGWEMFVQLDASIAGLGGEWDLRATPLA